MQGVINPGLFIEMKLHQVCGKSKRSVASTEQNEWREKLVAQGYDCRIAFGWEDAAAIIDGYLKR
jgi:hypothetical protein